MNLMRQYRYKRLDREVELNSTEPEDETTTTMAPSIAAAVTTTTTALPTSEDVPVTHPNVEQQLIEDIAEKTHREFPLLFIFKMILYIVNIDTVFPTSLL